jgi:hypothetical protein
MAGVSESTSSGVSAPLTGSYSSEHAWTPVAKTYVRLSRAASEVPGSMQHFAAALYLSEVVTKLHALALLGILERHEQTPSALSFELARASSTGSWGPALRDATTRIQPSMLAGIGADQWLAELRTWLTRKGRRPDEDALQPVLQPLAEPADLLADAGERTGARSPKTPVDLMELMVEVRNRTTGHRAYVVGSVKA